MKASILLLTKDAGPEFENVLERVRNQNTKHEVELVVVDSGSTDGTIERAKQYADIIKRIPAKEFHHSRTRNLAVELASGDVYIYLTQDALPSGEDWLEDLIAPLSNSNVSAVYGQQVAYPDAKPMDQFFYSYFYPNERRHLTADDIGDERQFYLQNIYISDVCAALRADVFTEIRFRPDIPMSEDKDFALRLLKAGHEIVYEPAATVYHSHDYTLLQLFKRRFRDGKAYTQIAGDEHNSVENAGGGVLGEGLHYLSEEMMFLAQNEYLWWIPYALVYDATNFLAFQAGRLKKRLSL